MNEPISRADRFMKRVCYAALALKYSAGHRRHPMPAETGWVYLSFVDEVDGVERFMGACVVRGNDAAEGAIEAHRLGINPGGEVLGIPVPKSELSTLPVNRLLAREELESMTSCVRIGDLDDSELALLQNNSEVMQNAR